MKRVLIACALLAPLAAFATDVASDPLTKGDAAAGATKSTPCVACHGVGGNGAINPEWPKLAGQGSAYINSQLKHFKSGERKQVVMMGQATMLGDQDMADVAAYFSSQKVVPGVGSADSLKVAAKLYRAGDASRGLPACAACHGPTGAGNITAQYPRLGGQNIGYTTNQLNNYKKGKDGERGGSKNALIMATVAAKLTDTEIAALASYTAGLQ
jgi:cytochrome c553